MYSLCGGERFVNEPPICRNAFFYSFALVFWLYRANIIACIWVLKCYLITFHYYHQASHKFFKTIINFQAINFSNKFFDGVGIIWLNWVCGLAIIKYVCIYKARVYTLAQ